MLSNGQLELLRSFEFRRRQKREVWDAYLQDPEGLERCAQRARAEGRRSGTTGAGLLLTMIRRGEHRLRFDPAAPRVTGWRFQRGTHSGTYVPDPEGVDPLPAGYGRGV
jgi:hypothetical protein